MMWPKIGYDLDGFFLAASNNIGSNAYDEIETALELADVIKLRYPESISKTKKFLQCLHLLRQHH